MNRQFDPEVIRNQITNLVADRERIDQAIRSLEGALRSLQELETQRELPLSSEASNPAESTLLDAVKHVCMQMTDGISRQRVTQAVERAYPSLKPVPSSVSAALINLSRGSEPMLKVAIEGSGRSPTVYSTQDTQAIKLTAEEAQELNDPNATKGTGGWQSLWIALQKNFNKSTGEITLTPQLRGRLYTYYHNYGGGGWQNKVKKVFRRELPHLFGS